jgi:hypothetical protein
MTEDIQTTRIITNILRPTTELVKYFHYQYIIYLVLHIDQFPYSVNHGFKYTDPVKYGIPTQRQTRH